MPGATRDGFEEAEGRAAELTAFDRRLDRTAEEIGRVAGPDFARAPVSEYLRMRDLARGLRDELRDAMLGRRCPPAALAAWEARLRPLLGEAEPEGTDPAAESPHQMPPGWRDDGEGVRG